MGQMTADQTFLFLICENPNHLRYLRAENTDHEVTKKHKEVPR